MTAVSDTGAEEKDRIRSSDLNLRFANLSGAALIRPLIADVFADRVALVSSFGADSAVLLHMISQIDTDLPVLFLETGQMFAETLEFQRSLSSKLNLTDVRLVEPAKDELRLEDPNNDLWQSDPDACCALRKIRPLRGALDGFEAWISGRKRFQTLSRGALPFFEDEAGKIKINPLANWSAKDVDAYLRRYDLPRHPLVASGYASIGCAPCTTPIGQDEDIRAGRWRDSDKIECGIHFQDGKATPLLPTEPSHHTR